MPDIRTHSTHSTHPLHERASNPTVAANVANALGSITHQQRSLQQQLQTIIASSTDMNSAAQQIAEVAAKLVNATFLSFVTAGKENPLDAIATVGNIASAPTLTFTFLQSLCLQSIESATVMTHAISAYDTRTVVSMPVQLNDGAMGAVVALLEVDTTPTQKRMMILELVSYAIQQWDTKNKIEHLDWEANTASAITELIGQIETSPSHDYACLLAANKLNEHFKARRSAIGLTGSRAGVTLKSISGKAEFDPQSPLVQQLTSAMDETIIRDELSTWPPLDDNDRHAVLQHKKLAHEQNEESVVSIPLQTVDGTTIGVWLSCGPKAALQDPRQVNALRSIAPYLATSLEVRKSADPGPIRSAIKSITGTDRPFGRTAILAGAGLLCLLPLLPVKHRIKSFATVEPVQHRYVTVPFNGVLKETFVRPGDRVTAGQLLAVMDDRELGYKLNDLEAQAGRAEKKSYAAMASGDIHEKQIARLEKESLDQQIEVLRLRKRNLEITADLDGFILKGDLEEAHGAPVKIGESLFEIAPLAPLKLEVAVPEDEIAYVNADMEVTARLDGYPEGTITGTIEALHPRSEIRDNRNVFIGEVILENQDHELKPGMSGRARVIGKRKMLGWVWLHKAVYRVRSVFGV